MSKRGPTYSWWYGIAFLAAAGITYWAASERWLIRILAGRTQIAYLLSLLFALWGVVLMAMRDFAPAERKKFRRGRSDDRPG
jgi:hypothetical protein